MFRIQAHRIHCQHIFIWRHLLEIDAGLSVERTDNVSGNALTMSALCAENVSGTEGLILAAAPVATELGNPVLQTEGRVTMIDGILATAVLLAWS
jgi:hypothetical protein